MIRLQMHDLSLSCHVTISKLHIIKKKVLYVLVS